MATNDSTGQGNLLGQETSPYLLQHKDNPVHWRAWGDAAFAEAKAAGKPVLLSIGYAACHWCHVMAHESFENGGIAGLMNDLFVNIKVDREERPDIDTIYQQSLALLGEHGGWPLTMFLTPEGEPFWGGTYFPPEDRWGRPGFPSVLQRIAEIYRTEGDKVRSNADTLKAALADLAANKPGGDIPIALTDDIAEHFLRMVDTVHGGIGGAPKFPQTTAFELLWRAYKRQGVEQYKGAVTVTLDRMCQGGIYDHLGGGFARYATDAAWLVPHFEKMLYDNAQLIDLLTLVWQDTKSPLYAMRVRETVGWLLREMVVDGGGFAGTLDADSEGEEGKFYVWSEAEIDDVLGADAERFKTAYDVTGVGNWEGKTILNRTKKPVLGDDAHEAALAAAREKLLAARGSRIRPGIDDKVMVDWNGLMIAALANAGTVFGEPGWIDAAKTAFAFVQGSMTEHGRLRHSWCGGRLDHPATLEDYANTIRAALALFEATGDPDYLAAAEGYAEQVEAHFADPDGGGYFLSADDVTDVLVRTKPIHDNATPSGNGIMIAVLARLFYLTGKADYRERAGAIVRAFSGELERNAMAMPLLFNANEMLAGAVQIAICGEAGADDTAALAAAAQSVSVPNRVTMVVAPGDELPTAHPAAGKGIVDGRAAAYVCRGMTCTLPITEPTALAAELANY